jgi:hypothetical protein
MIPAAVSMPTVVQHSWRRSSCSGPVIHEERGAYRRMRAAFSASVAYLVALLWFRWRG